MVDTLDMTKRLNKLREYVGLLMTMRREPRERFTTEPLVDGNAERYLQLSIQCVLDVGNHILADRKLREPEEYRDIIQTLGEQSVIPQDLAKRLLALVGLRNILVHDYLDVDRAKRYDAPQTELEDLEEFARHMSRLW